MAIVLIIFSVIALVAIYKRATYMSPEEEAELELVMEQFREYQRYHRLGVMTDEEYLREKKALEARINDIQKKYNWLINL